MNLFSFLDGIQIYQIIILVAGLVFLIIEMFTPGFGFSGGLGLLLLVVGIILTASTAFEALVMIVMLFIIVGVALAVILRSAAKGRLSKTLVLNKTLDKKSGYSGSEELESFVGKEGIALTALRPAGTADFDGVRLDVVSEGVYISRNTKIKVIKVSGRRVVVRAA